MSHLVVEGLHKSFGRQPVLRSLDLAVPDGCLMAILGPSGSGKTTLLRLIAGFERPDAGGISLGGRIFDDARTHVPPEGRGIGYVPQEGRLFPHLTVEGNIAFGLSRGPERSQRVAELLNMVGLEGFGQRYPHQLSGGQQQRIALARALAIRPALLLLDEPFASLDASLRASVRADVLGILRATTTTTLLVTHDQDEALSSADLVAIIRDGRIAQCATPDDVYTRPVDAGVARFVGEANLVRGQVQGTTVATPFGLLTLQAGLEPGPDGTAVTVCIRPEQINLQLGNNNGGLPGRIVRCDYHGHDVVLTTRPDDGEQPLIVSRAAGKSSLRSGARVFMNAYGPVLAWPGSAEPPAERRLSVAATAEQER